MAKRLIKIADRIVKHGYCQGKYADAQPIKIVDGYTSTHDGSKGYNLISGNHRASALAGLGRKTIKVEIWEHYC